MVTGLICTKQYILEGIEDTFSHSNRTQRTFELYLS